MDGNFQKFRLDSFRVLKKEYFRISVMGVFMMGIVLVLLGLVLFFRLKHSGQGGRELTDAVRVLFVGLSLAQLLIIPFVQKQLVLKSQDPQSIYRQPEFWPKFIKSLVRAAFVIYVLSLIPSVLGVGLYFLSGKVADFMLLSGISVICFLFYFPQYDQWENQLKEHR